MRLLSGVGAHVRLEVVRTGEFPLADIALEWSDASVLAAVSTKLIRSGEPLPAPLVVTDVRLLPSVLADVHLQVGELQVALGAARIEAYKRLSLLLSLGHDGVCVDQLRWLRHLLSDMRDDESRL